MLVAVTPGGASRTHRHGTRVHAHPYVGPHRHVRHGFRRSAPVDGVAHAHTHGEHGHSHGLIDDSIKRSRDGIRAVSLSLGVLGLTALTQTAVFLASGSIALLADLIHNFGDALTAVPLGIAFALHSQVAERRAGLAVVGAIFISACVAGIEAVQRLIHPSPPTHLFVLRGRSHPSGGRAATGQRGSHRRRAPRSRRRLRESGCDRLCGCRRFRSAHRGPAHRPRDHLSDPADYVAVVGNGAWPPLSLARCSRRSPTNNWLHADPHRRRRLTFMMLMYALERRGTSFVLAFAVGCVLASVYGFLAGTWPFGVVARSEA